MRAVLAFVLIVFAVLAVAMIVQRPGGGGSSREQPSPHSIEQEE